MDKQIDDNLRRVYEQTLSEAVPDRFLDLIAQLKAREGQSGAQAPGEEPSDHGQ